MDLRSSESAVRFRWAPSVMGGMVAIGTAALLGTLVTNASLWLALARGLTLQQAYAGFGYTFSSPTEVISFAVVLLSGFLGGYIAAAYGGTAQSWQALAAGLVATSFFVVMALGPSSSLPPTWYVALHLAGTVIASLAGGLLRGKRAV